MSIEALTTLGAALGSIKTITDIASTVTNVKIRQELNGKIADVQEALLKARQEMLDLQDKYETVLEENKLLKASKAVKEEKPHEQWGCYKFEGDETLYCPVCYENKGEKRRTLRLDIHTRQCSSCRSLLKS